MNGGGVSRRFFDDGEAWLLVSPGHAIAEQWITQHAPEMYAAWQASCEPADRDAAALQIEQRLGLLEPDPTTAPATSPATLAGHDSDGSNAQDDQPSRIEPRAGSITAQADAAPPPATLRTRVEEYEHAAARLGVVPLHDPARARLQLAHQAAGDQLRQALGRQAADHATRDLLHRLDVADLVADRPAIEAIHSARVVVAQLAPARVQSERYLGGDAAVAAEMTREHPAAALRADILLAIAAAGHDLVTARDMIARADFDPVRLAPALGGASEFYARHAPIIQAQLDREIRDHGHRDLASYLLTWRQPPETASLHDLEHAVTAHTIAQVIGELTGDGQDELRAAQRMWDRAVARTAAREPNPTPEPDRLEPSIDRRAEEPELELDWEIDDDIDNEYGGAEQEVR
jgi:hypothetical protein